VIPLDEIWAAGERALPYVRRTPLHPLDGGAWLKLELLQPTGSFKVRGAMAALSRLGPKERKRGVVTASAGNHGLGVAYAAARLGIAATILLPEDASEAKVAAIGRFPVRLEYGGPDYDAVEPRAHQLAHETGAVYVSPYNDPWVIAGQGSIGVELLEDAPDLDLVLVPVGGGGLISGIGAWLKSVRRQIRVIGIQSQAWPSMERALAAGRIVPVEGRETLADGLAGNIEAGSMTFELAQQVVDEMTLVSEAAIEEAIREAYRELRLPFEGSGAVGIAALLSGPLRDVRGRRVAVVVTGRNIAAEKLAGILGGAAKTRQELPMPRSGLFDSGDPSLSGRTDDLLNGFGEDQLPSK
jgi:threonine dehydratase